MQNSGRVNESRTGFTLVELLVVVAIIGILASMLMPAINSARESARGAQCLSNVRQVAQACTSYSSQNGDQMPAVSSGMNSGMVKLMPYLELSPLFDAINGNNYTIRGKIPIYTCPSAIDLNADGQTNYVMCIGSRSEYATDPDGGTGSANGGWDPSNGTDDNNGQMLGSDGRGAFHPSSKTSTATMRDGASNTMLFSEKREDGHVMGDATTKLTYHGGNKPNHNTDNSAFDALNETHAHSNHPGGVNAAFGDGHAEFYGNDCDENIWKALSTANNGEPWGMAGKTTTGPPGAAP